VSDELQGEVGSRRLRMVEEQLVRRGIDDEAVLSAMRSVPRHLFLPEALSGDAYQDMPLAIGYGQTISQPYMVAIMTSLLGVDVRSRVLEIGSGSGYQTAVLAEVVDEVYAVERLAPLAERARRVLQRLGYRNVRQAIADGSKGWSRFAPYDAILVAAAAEPVPPALLGQLVDGGRLVLPVGRPWRDQVLTVLERVGDGFVRRLDTRCRFVPLVADERDERPAASPRRQGPPRDVQEDEPGKAVTARVYGRVQGVYYRASAQREASRLRLAGWVRNEDDGSVTLHVQGAGAEVDAMLGWCRTGPPAADVDWVEAGDAEPDPSLSDFEVR
jgi:protein-L-isoaspartate(D-aspartate) O-methyltransferase